MEGSYHEVICPDCQVPMRLKESRYGKFYGCSKWPLCTMSHGAHEDGTPLGVPANKETRRARVMAHEVFDRLWKSKLMPRSMAYRYLCRIMQMDKEHAHIGRFSVAECRQVSESVERFFQLTDEQRTAMVRFLKTHRYQG